LTGLLALFVAVLAIYFILGTVLAWASRRSLKSRNIREYYVAGGRLGTFLSALTYAATTYSSFMIVGLVGFAYATGVGSLGFELSYYVATLGLLSLVSYRVWTMSRARGWISPGEMIGDLAGARWIAVLAGILYLGALIPYASAQVKAIGETIAASAGGHYYLWGVLFGLAVMLVWSGLAGIWSVAVTDALQGLWMLVAGTLLLAWLVAVLHSHGITLSMVGRVLDSKGLMSVGKGFWTPAMFLAFTAPWIFFAVTNPQVVQRLYMPKDERSLKGMIKWFGVFGLYYTVLVTLIGLLARGGVMLNVLDIHPAKKDQVTPLLLTVTNPVLGAIVFTSIIAASVSTADSILLTLASIAAEDLTPSGWDEGKKRIVGYAALVIVAILMAAVAALRISYIVALSVLSSVLLLGFAVPTLALVAGLRVEAWSVALSILTAPAVIIAGYLYGLHEPVLLFAHPVHGLPLSAWILIISTIITLLGVRRGSR